MLPPNLAALKASPASSPHERPSLFLVRVAVARFVSLDQSGSAAGSPALARRADDRELLDAGADIADIGLTEEEKRELLTE